MLIDNITIKGITYNLIPQSKNITHPCENCDFNNVDDTKTTCQTLKTFCTTVNDSDPKNYIYDNYIFSKQKKLPSTQKECSDIIDCIGYQIYGIKACIICKHKT